MPAFPSTIGRLLERSARRRPDRVALLFGERRWTFAELDAATGQRGRHRRRRAPQRRARRAGA